MSASVVITNSLIIAGGGERLRLDDRFHVDAKRELGFCCEPCGLGTGGPPGAWNVSARTKIVVVGEAVSANVHVMNAAMDDGSLRAAEIAAAADTLGSFRSAGSRCIAPGRAGFHIKTASSDKSA